MTIGGLQKLSLLDYPDHTCCTVFTSGCNLRCPYCHNPSLVQGCSSPLFETGDIFAFLEKRRGLLDGVCVSGGEPLLQPGLEEFLAQVKQMGFQIKLDTNGSFPAKLEHLIHAGLVDYAAMDIKSSPLGYGTACGIDNYDVSDINESVELLRNSGIDYEFRTTVVSPLHKADDFIAIGNWLHGVKRYYLQAFIDTGDLLGSGFSTFAPDVMADFLTLVQKKIPTAQLRGM